MIQLAQSEKTVLFTTMRMSIYFVVLTLVSVGIWKIADVFGGAAFGENGIIENTQCVFLMIAGFIFALSAWKNKANRIAMLGLSALCMLGICREQDAWFDANLPILSWRVGYIFPVLVSIYGLCHFKNFKKQILDLLKTPACSLMFSAMVVIIPFAQCIGHRPLIKAVIESDDSGIVFAIRRMIEESGELLGYLMIVLAAIELLMNLHKRKDA